ncbi:ATP-binding protein [uncultured Gulosibacter sp.]|uniref:ATP-binding protein n=1 Tax=uncultured Gulosibacter sp. TaxID=1339167 RepID=UPI002889C35E|nr:ATP-binding protein [uncultured Gulosibacter sp.]
MTDTQDLVDRLRAHGAEPTSVEVKAASGGFPKSLLATISAFANGEGGTILLGLSDSSFEPVEIDADALRDALAGVAVNRLHPPVRGEIEIQLIDDGHRIVRFDVPELAADAKPCYIETQGQYGGSYIRTGEGDHRLTTYEVNRLIENRKQPTYDMEVVPEAVLSDLDADLTENYIERLRTQSPRAFGDLSDEAVLRRVRVVKDDGGVIRPTLAGLLTFGAYPQEFFPQLFVSVVVVPGTDMSEEGPRGERFLENRTVDGPIPLVVEDVLKILMRNMRRASIIDGAHRRDRWDYPLSVLRELTVNALMHRDYSPEGRGSQVQVELYADRLVVRSPGGFFGSVSASDFGAPDVSSSRNSLLAKLLSETPLPGSGSLIAENRGSGIPAIFRELNKAGMKPPRFEANLRRVEVTVRHHELLSADVMEWISDLGVSGLTDTQIQALAVMRGGDSVRNQTLQGWGLHSADATRELGQLVQSGLAEKIGDRRGAKYILSNVGCDSIPDSADADALVDSELGQEIEGAESKLPGAAVMKRQARLLEVLRDTPDGTLAAKELAAQLEVSPNTILGDLKHLIDTGRVEATAPPRNKYRRYRLAE